MKTRLFALLLAFCLLTAVAPALALETTVDGIMKYGNLILSISASDFLQEGYTYGDVLNVDIAGLTYDMPVGTSYSDVPEGSMVCRVVINPEEGSDHVILAVNMGDLATASGIAAKILIEEEPGYRWDVLVPEPVEITLSMKQAGGYLNEFLLRNLVRTNERADYAHLSDEAFANFRAVSTTGMGKHMLYRTSSPVNPELGRSTYADQALSSAGVRTIINLADSEEVMHSYEGFAQSAYASCSVLPLNLGIDFKAEDFRLGLANGLRFLTQHEGPYLVHCTEGKDRAGFVSAVLECLMGASAEEVAADYMITYFNYYGVQPGTQQYQVLAESNIISSLQAAFQVEDLYAADLAAEAQQYLLEEIKLTEDEIALLKQKLAGN